MPALDRLLALLAIAATGIGLLVNQQMCQTTSGMGAPSTADRCIPVFPGPALVGLAIAALAAAVLAVRILRRPRPLDG